MKRTIAFEEKPENKYALFVYLKKTVKQSVLQACANWNGAFMKRQVLHLDRNLCEKVTGDRYLRHFLRRRENWEQKEFHACNRIGNAASRVLQLSCGFVFDSLSEEKTDPRTGETYVLENHIYRY